MAETRGSGTTVGVLVASVLLWACCGLSRSRFAPPGLAFLADVVWLEAALVAQVALALVGAYARAPRRTLAALARGVRLASAPGGVIVLWGAAIACQLGGAPTHATLLAPVAFFAALGWARRAAPEATLSAPSFEAWVLSGGTVACAATLLFGVSLGGGERVELLGYFTVLGLLPACLALGYPILRRRPGGAEGIRLLGLATLVGLVAVWLAPRAAVLAGAVLACGLSLVAPLTSSRLRAACGPNRRWGRWADAAAECLPPTLVVFACTCSPWVRGELFSQLTRDAWFAVGALGGLAAVVSLRKLPAPRSRASRWAKVGLGIAALAVAGLFCDAHLRVDTVHYGAYLGPANAVLGGRTPLVEVHCQYGLGYLVYSAAFLLVPRTYEAAALVTTLVNAAFFALVLVNGLQVCRLARLPLAGGALVLAAYASVLGYNFTTTPSVAGLRFLPLHLLIFALLRLPAGRTHSGGALAALGLCAAWSVEALAFGLGVYLLVGVARELAGGGGRAALALALGAPFAAAAAAAGALCALLRLWAGRWPDLADSWAIVDAHLASDGAVSWAYLLDPRSVSWLPLALVTLGVSAAVGRAILARRSAPLSPDALRDLCGLFALAALSTAELSIFAMRSFGAILATVMLPGVVLGWALVERGLRSPAWRARAWLVLVAGVPLVSGYSLSSLARPVEPYDPTALLVRTVFSDPRAPGRALRKLATPTAAHPARARLQVGGGMNRGVVRSPELSEGLVRLERWAADRREVVLFSAVDTPLLFLSGRIHAYPISNVANDQLSPPLVRRLLSQPPPLRAEQPVFVTCDLDSLEPLQRALLWRLVRGWALEPVDLSGALEVYRLVPLPAGSSNPAWEARLLAPR